MIPRECGVRACSRRETPWPAPSALARVHRPENPPRTARGHALGVALVGVLAAALLAGALGVGFMIAMPGESYRGAPFPLGAAEERLARRVERHVVHLAGKIGERNLWRPQALDAAAVYIRERLEAAGPAVREQTYTVQGRTVRNLEAVLPGGAGDARSVVVGAHYDSVRGSPGANDNATGVAALIEIARLLGEQNLPTQVRLVAFVNEEPPFSYTEHMGSLVYARALAERGERLAGMLSLETIGHYSDEPGSQRYPFPFGLFYPSTGNFVGFVGNLRSAGLVRRAVGSFRRHARFPSEGTAAPGWIMGVGWSDHWSFWQQGYPAIMVTDTAPFRYDEYHTAADRPDVVDFRRLARVVAGLARVVADLAGGDGVALTLP